MIEFNAFSWWLLKIKTKYIDVNVLFNFERFFKVQ